MASGAESAHTFRDRYRLLELVGEGTNARVYTADDLTLHRRVAVKILREELAADEGFRQRFEQEMRAASSLSFPRLLPVYDWGLDPLPHLVTEHVNGGSLADMLAAGRRLSPSQALEVGFEVARALANIHRAGGAYCGLTASSIMFDSEARVFVSDLGVAAAIGAAGLDKPDPNGDPAAKASGEPQETESAAIQPDATQEDATQEDAATAATEPDGDADAAATAATEQDAIQEDAATAATEPDAIRPDAIQEDAATAATEQDGDADDAGSGSDESDPWGIGADSWDTEVWDIETWGLDDTGREDAAEVDASPAEAESSTQPRHSPDDQQRDVHDLALLLNEAVTGMRSAPTSVGEGLFPVSILLGPLNPVLERATAVDPAERLDAAGLVEELLEAASLLPRPDPLPIVPVDAVAAPIGDDGPLALVASAPTGHESQAGLARARLSAIPLDDVLRRRWPGLVLAVALVLGGSIAGVWAWMESRPETVAVPDLAGRDRQAAAEAVSAHGLEAREILVREPGTQRGEVVRTEPPAGVELDAESTVALFVSLGEPLVALDFDVYGHTVLDATALVEERGLAVEGEVTVNDEGVPPGLVVGLDVAEGVYELEPGSAVGLRVSEGPAARTVPAVPEDRTSIAAVEALYAARLQPAEVTEFSADVPAGEVIGFSPASGTTVEADSVVEIRVSQGPEPPPPEPEEPAETEAEEA